MRGRLEIEWLEDGYDCETCGGSYAIGMRATLDGVAVLELKPVAHCYAGQSWDRDVAMIMLLEKLGYELTVDFP